MLGRCSREPDHSQELHSRRTRPHVELEGPGRHPVRRNLGCLPGRGGPAAGWGSPSSIYQPRPSDASAVNEISN